MKKYCIILIILLFMGCQTVQTETGTKHKVVDSRVTDVIHSGTHLLDIPVKFVCDIASHTYEEAGKIVGIEPKEEVKTEKQLLTEENIRVWGAIAVALLAL